MAPPSTVQVDVGLGACRKDSTLNANSAFFYARFGEKDDVTNFLAASTQQLGHIHTQSHQFPGSTRS
jgi:hypothetical protein